MSETFYGWLMKQTRRNSPTGDIARDVEADANFPGEGDTFQVYRKHLEKMGACDDAMEALAGAWRDYKRAQRKGGDA